MAYTYLGLFKVGEAIFGAGWMAESYMLPLYYEQDMYALG